MWSAVWVEEAPAVPNDRDPRPGRCAMRPTCRTARRGDNSERVGGLLLQRLADATKAQVPEAAEITQLIQAGNLALKTYAISSNSFKERLTARGLDPAIVQEYRLARLSHFLWVVEAIDRSRRARQEPAVLGEVIFDATSSENDPQQLAIHVPGVAWVHRTKGNPRFPIRCAPTPYLSGSVGPM